MSDEPRLARIEVKLDKLTSVISDIVRVEERISAGSDRVSRLEHRMDIYEEDFGDLKDIVQQYAATAKTGEKLFWLGITAVGGAIAWLINLVSSGTQP